MRLFEILDKLNQADIKNGTSNVGICNEVVSVDKKGNNGYVKIGIPGNIAQELVLKGDDKALMLLIVDRKEFEALKKADDNFFTDNLPQAIHVLTYNLRCDDAYKETWVANIAMAFQDAFWQYVDGESMDNEAWRKRIHTISNDAAKQFISNLTQTNGSNS